MKMASRQLAIACGVSHGTVDRALHGRGRISAETKKLILDKAEAMGFIPNRAFSEIIGGKSSLVGFIVPAINSAWCLEVLFHTQRILAEIGLKVMAMFVHDDAEFQAVMLEFAQRRALAVIFIPQQRYIEVSRKIANNVRLLSLAHDYGNPAIPSLRTDDAVLTRMALDRLFAAGHRRIMLYTYDAYITSHRARETRYRKLMAAKKLSPTVVYGALSNVSDYTAAHEVELMRTVRDGKITAIMCFVGQMSLRVMRILRDNGLGVPEDVSVLALSGDNNFLADHPEISAFTYSHEPYALGIARWIQNGKTGFVHQPYRPHEGGTVKTI